MCNYFGGSCAGPREEDLKRYSEQAQREYMASLAHARWNPWENLEREMKDAANYPDPMSRSQPGIAATPDPDARVGESQAEARSRRWGWLSQSDIDRPLPPQPRRSLRQWLSDVPGGWSTVIVLVAFVAGLWGAYLFYQLLTSPEAVKAVSTAGRG